MTLFEIVAVLVTLAALFSYLNHRLLRLPTAVGLMVITLSVSLLLVATSRVFPFLGEHARALLDRVDFGDALMHGMLGFLLFAGALHIDLGDLARQKRIVAVLATFGVVISTVLVGLMTWGIVVCLGLPVGLLHCLLFGALISPTDPIAVLGMLKNLGAPRSLATKIAGESLFNDGIGVVVFTALLAAAGLGHDQTSSLAIAQLLVVEVVGGALFGFGVGYLAYRMLKSVDQYQVEILLSAALVAGGYALADRLGLSAPIAMVVAGLLIGNHGRSFAMSETTRRHLDTFWELIDDILNAVLFVLIGLEMLIIQFAPSYLVAGLLAVPATLGARFVAVGVPVVIMRRVRSFSPHVIKVLTWGGLRGGISVAMALWLGQYLAETEPETRNVVLVMTFVVVVFSIVVQGLTIGGQLRRWGLAEVKRDTI